MFGCGKMGKKSKVEGVVADYYERIWSRFVLWWESEKTLGLHYALYDKNIKSFEQAVYNMNDYVGSLVDLQENKTLNILDAGCGIGGTSIYLAQKFPQSYFTGITITPGQLALAHRFAEERQVDNADFMLASYIDTDFSDDCFHTVFALESVCYAQDKKQFIKEMYRVLESGGKLAVIDTFFTRKPHNFFMKKLHDFTCMGRGVPPDADLLLDDFVADLKKEGFTDITVNNISRKVARSQLRSFLIGIPFFLSSAIKYIASFGRIDLSKDPDYFVGASVLCAVYGLSGSGAYCSVTATKK